MRRGIFLLSTILFMAACTKDVQSDTPVAAESNSDLVAVNFVAEVPEFETKAAFVHTDGKGQFADQCKLQVRYDGAIVCERVADVVNYKAVFSGILLPGNLTYDFLFWADNKEGKYYVTDDLTRVGIQAYIGGDDKRDAFYACVSGNIGEAFSKEITLRRPFAQLNVICKDIAEYFKQLPDPGEFPQVIPDEVSLSVKVPTVFDVKSGIASQTETVTYSTKVYTSPYDVDAEYNKLSMDYFLASTDGDVVSVDFSAKNNKADMQPIEHHWENIPLKRNYRTNIVGSILSVEGKISVLIMPEWDNPEYYYNF